jgi:hypothetical protein
MIGLLLVAMLAACAPAVTGEPTVESEPDETPTRGGSALNPVPGDDSDMESGDTGGYPAASDSAASGYPAAGEASLLPGEAYPGSTLVAPVEVDLSQLTPVAGDPTPQVMPAPGRPGGDPPISQGLLLEAVTTNLSQQFNLPADSITVVSVEPVTWPNGGLGCPQEGMAYAEVMVEGSRVTLEAGGQTYTYHTAGTTEFVLCVDGVPAGSGTVPRR